MARDIFEARDVKETFMRWFLTDHDAGLIVGRVIIGAHHEGCRVQTNHVGCSPTGLVAMAFELLMAADEAFRASDEDTAVATARIGVALAALGFTTTPTASGARS
ncbi:hypothetical protein ASF27_01600 [Methylobacterium sp. Leaf102]|uniref:hypothetical protein n=1 Tax=Methylobacterium sp. Leaf102 TaxID=1736253 RepID=UPI0006FC8CEF|nr:hypothetical protein [Methylobacterium sp. Leaf102]KQP34283.1 hypothetical protein ASF27_01600 [Methylobacterium sp. Leaf102]